MHSDSIDRERVMGAVAKMDSRHRITIPKEFRDRPGWKPGQKIFFVSREGRVLLVPEDEFESPGISSKGAPPDNRRDGNDRS
jgi:AbrB family looped-hinge helix DNA binding protein